MSGIGDVRGDDAVAYYAGTIGATRSIAVADGVSATLRDADGPLEPGRYLMQVLNWTSSSAKIWVRFGRFEKGHSLEASAGPPNFPLAQRGIIALELNVLPGDNDRAAAIGDGGGGTLYLTRISRSG